MRVDQIVLKELNKKGSPKAERHGVYFIFLRKKKKTGQMKSAALRINRILCSCADPLEKPLTLG
jgi:hypothetical protein